VEIKATDTSTGYPVTITQVLGDSLKVTTNSGDTERINKSVVQYQPICQGILQDTYKTVVDVLQIEKNIQKVHYLDPKDPTTIKTVFEDFIEIVQVVEESVSLITKIVNFFKGLFRKKQA
jgi:hypothetical protein